MLRYGTSGCPVRALRSAAGRRVHWKSRRYLRLVFLIFGVKGGRHWRLCQFFWREQAARGRANRRTQIDATDHTPSPRETYLENLPRGPHSSGESAAGGAASFRGTEMVPYLE